MLGWPVTTHKCSVRHVINNSQLTVILSLSISTGFYLCLCNVHETLTILLLSPCHKSGGFMQWQCHSVCSFVCCLKRVLVGHWLTGPAMLAPCQPWVASQPVPDMLMAAGAYHIHHSGCTGLLILLSLYFDRTVIFLSRIHANLGVACWLNAVIHNCMC